MGPLLTQDYLEEEAAKGKRRDFIKVLKAVPRKEPLLIGTHHPYTAWAGVSAKAACNAFFII